jgi:magnesium transporter
VTLDFPVVKRINTDHPYEVKFIMGKQLLVTAQYEEMEAIDKFKKHLEVVMTLKKPSAKSTGAHLFLGLLGELYATTSTKLDYVESVLAEIETEIFQENEQQMVVRIADVSKKLIAFRHIVRAQDDILRDVQPLCAAAFKNAFTSEFQHIHTEYFTLLRRVDTMHVTLNDLRETNMAMLTTKQNEIMKILTIMAFITFPLTLFTSTFGMNTATTPIIGVPGDFWIIIGIMSVVTVLFFAFFRYKRWL